MGIVSRTHNREPLKRRPSVEVLGVQRFTRGPGESGMEMKVGDEPQEESPRLGRNKLPGGGGLQHKKKISLRG